MFNTFKYISLSTLILLFSSSVDAQGFPYLKKENPNELTVIVFQDGCPVKKGTYQNVAEETLILSRIKPSRTRDGLMLLVQVDCRRPVTGNHQIFSIKTNYGKFLTTEEGKPLITYDSNFGFLGENEVSEIRKGVKRSVESALIPYLKTNFGL